MVARSLTVLSSPLTYHEYSTALLQVHEDGRGGILLWRKAGLLECASAGLAPHRCTQLYVRELSWLLCRSYEKERYVVMNSHGFMFRNQPLGTKCEGSSPTRVSYGTKSRPIVTTT